jgi:hypothetical protein
MSELSGFGIPAWLPPRVAARLADEEAHERAQARRDEAERADQAEKRHMSAVAAYKAAAEQRGEYVSAVAIARGEGIGRSVDDTLRDAAAAADREDARAAARDRRGRDDVCYLDAPEPTIHASRSAWPESSYELDRMLREARDLHTDLVHAQARLASRAGRIQEHLEAVRRDRAHSRASEGGQGTITRYLPCPPCSGCGYVRCECR